MKLDSKGYICRGKACMQRNWFIAKHSAKGTKKRIDLRIFIGEVCIPAHLEGKRVRFKIEIVGEGE